ncbi:MAG TPA: hypothetical protein PLK76_04300 [bacterium]|nr:hypothetical protein [bacterium]
MYNWSTDTKELKKDKTKYTIWQLEQMVNFGLHNKKIKKSILLKYWSKLHLDKKKKNCLSFLLWSK